MINVMEIMTKALYFLLLQVSTRGRAEIVSAVLISWKNNI